MLKRLQKAFQSKYACYRRDVGYSWKIWSNDMSSYFLVSKRNTENKFKFISNIQHTELLYDRKEECDKEAWEINRTSKISSLQLQYSTFGVITLSLTLLFQRCFTLQSRVVGL